MPLGLSGSQPCSRPLGSLGNPFCRVYRYHKWKSAPKRLKDLSHLILFTPTLIKNRTHGLVYLVKLQAVILTANVSKCLLHFYKLLGHCLRVVPFKVKKSSKSLLLHRYSNCKSKLYMSLCIVRPQHKDSLGHLWSIRHYWQWPS